MIIRKQPPHSRSRTLHHVMLLWALIVSMLIVKEYIDCFFTNSISSYQPVHAATTTPTTTTIIQKEEKEESTTTTTTAIQQPVRKASDNTDVYPYYRPITQAHPNDFGGVLARPFQPLPYTVPCRPASVDWNKGKLQYSNVTDQALVFLSPYKTGSTTGAGIHLRLSQQLARKMLNNNSTNTNTTTQICENRHRHKIAYNLIPPEHRHNRRRDTFVWTVIRDPTTRVVSQFFYDLAENSHKQPRDENFMDYLQKSFKWKSLIYHHYIGRLAFSKLDYNSTNKQYYVDIANSLFDDLDFIAVTERMDESIVAMSMLINVTLGDVLYLKANKAAGEFSLHARKPQCNYILKSFVSPGMRTYFKQDDWQDKIYWDHIVHQAANRSLDLTIDQLGREAFDKRLALYQYAKKVAQQDCLEKTPLPCSSSGEFTKQTDCMFLDAGCGHSCLDEVVKKLDLDNRIEI